MLGALLITLREGLEAALVIGIILAYLDKTHNRHGFKPTWIGVALATMVSLLAGAVIYLVAGELTGRAEQIFEGLAMFAAAGILTWMIFWMRRQASDIKTHLHARMRSLLSSGSTVGLAMLAFVVVVREGIETALFLFAATRVAGSAVSLVTGGLLGLVIAIAIGYGIYKGTSRLNLRTFFNVTSVLLIVFAAGLLAHGIHEFHEAGVIPPVVEHLWDTNRILPEQSTLGRFLTAIVGYNANPSLVETIAYLAYLVLVLGLYFRSAGDKQELEEKRSIKAAGLSSPQAGEYNKT